MLSLLLIFGLNFHSNVIEENHPVEIKIQEVIVEYCDICAKSNLEEDVWWHFEEKKWNLVGKFIITNNTNKTIKIKKDFNMYAKDFNMYAIITDDTGNKIDLREYPGIEYTNFRSIVPLPVVIPKSENVLVNFFDFELWRYNLMKGEKYKIQYIFHVGYNRKLKRQLKVDSICSNVIEFEYSPVIEHW